jgi:UDP-N-acetylglucosamine 2-epimerase (non-hydrolysing)
VTIRENTERPETVEVGANIIAGFEYEGIVRAARTMLGKNGKWINPFGDGNAGKKIIEDT